MPESKVGADRPDMTKGNKVEPTTKAKPAPGAQVGRTTAAEKERRAEEK